MKKKLALFLVAILLLSAVPCCFAEEAFSLKMEEAITQFNKEAKESNISIKKEKDGQYYRYYLDFDGGDTGIDCHFYTDDNDKITSLSIVYEDTSYSVSETADIEKISVMATVGNYMSSVLDNKFDDDGFLASFYEFYLGTSDEIRYRTDNAIHKLTYNYLSAGYLTEGMYSYQIIAD